ncbi:hypothetical protein CRG98_017358 [Punica granatum]|uniref:Uncharacterized protein n=1 Tax=Punica granatum TaxID=22663 RepID=A0A2I0K0Y3_PUNGR|nr:hypothetical protein CRG98_017358 [Punica granatum]
MDEVVTGGDGISSNPTSSGQAASLLPYNLPLFSAFLAFALAQFLKLFTTWSGPSSLSLSRSIYPVPSWIHQFEFCFA